MDQRYALDEQKVVHEELENEVVVVNLDSGHYYILEATAIAIWKLLVGGASLAETVEALHRRYAGDRPAIQDAVATFVAELEQEGLLTGASPTNGAGAAAFDAPAPAGEARFELPVMYRYTDMATLILMDPIRDFDETGWPRRRPSPGSPSR
jgi:hypothetical protein